MTDSTSAMLQVVAEIRDMLLELPDAIAAALGGDNEQWTDITDDERASLIQKIVATGAGTVGEFVGRLLALHSHGESFDARLRFGDYNGRRLVVARMYREDDGALSIIFDEPQRIKTAPHEPAHHN